MPPGLSRTPSARGMAGGGSSMAGVTLQQLMAEGDTPTDVAGRLLERVKELERKVRVGGVWRWGWGGGGGGEGDRLLWWGLQGVAWARRAALTPPAAVS
jgi:hypothetical protein